MENRRFLGIWIPSEIWTDTKISISEKCLLAEVSSLGGLSDQGCWASNQHFCQFLSIEERWLLRLFKHLESLGLLERKVIRNTRFLFVRGGLKATPPGLKATPPGLKATPHYIGKREQLKDYSSSDTPVGLEEIPEKEKEEEKFVCSIEEFRKYLNRGKLETECPWKIGDLNGWEMMTADCYDHHVSRGKRIRKEYADRVLRNWLFPKYETEKDRNAMRAAWEKSKKRPVATFSETEGVVSREEYEKQRIELENALISLSIGRHDELFKIAEDEIRKKYPSIKNVQPLVNAKFRSLAVEEYRKKSKELITS